MIGKQVKGRGFRGALNYILNPIKGERIGGNMDGNTARELAKEFAAMRGLNVGLKQPVYHVSLSLCPGETLSTPVWNEIADRYMAEMGFTYSPYIVARHVDRDHDHIHIVASRIGMDGRTVSDSNNYRRSEEIIRKIEKEYGLQEVISSHAREAGEQKKSMTSGELRKVLGSGEPSVKMILQKHIDEAVAACMTFAALEAHLRNQGVTVIPNIAKTGTVSGISFSVAGEIMKGSDLGKAYSFLGLQRRGISYEKERDLLPAHQEAGVNPCVEIRETQREGIEVSSGSMPQTNHRQLMR